MLTRLLSIASLILFFACNRESKNGTQVTVGEAQSLSCDLPALLSDFWEIEQETTEELFAIAEEIDPRERQRLMQAALEYLQRYGRRQLMQKKLQDIQKRFK